MTSTPKIRGFLASEKCRGLFLYRRTNKTTYLISLSYEKKKDKLALGSGFYGRLYPNRCDISPNGEDFIYFAMGLSLREYGVKFTAWTAICKPPEIKAHLFIGQNDTWGGGGVFINRHLIYVNRTTEGTAENKYNGYTITHDPKLYDNSLHFGRDWEALEKEKYGNVNNARKTVGDITIERSVKSGRHGEYSMFSYIIKDKDGNAVEGLDKINWCDFDNFGRFITAVGSKIKIYDGLKSLKKNTAKEFDLEELVVERKAKAKI